MLVTVTALIGLWAGPPAPTVQRPEGMDPIPEPPAATAEPAQPQPTLPPTVSEPYEPAPPSDPVPIAKDPDRSHVRPDVPGGASRIHGRLYDREIAGAPLANTRVELSCPCLIETVTAFTDATGDFEVDELPPGVYTVRAERGGPPSSQIVSVGPAQTIEVELTLAPPTTTEELERRAGIESRARTMIAMGGVAEVAAIGLLVATGVENSKPACNFDLDDCAAAPRPKLAAALGITGGLLAAGGAALIGVGVHRLRRLRAEIAISDGEVAFVFSGKF